jgi:hypothetical protein
LIPPIHGHQGAREAFDSEVRASRWEIMGDGAAGGISR